MHFINESKNAGSQNCKVQQNVLLWWKGWMGTLIGLVKIKIMVYVQNKGQEKILVKLLAGARYQPVSWAMPTSQLYNCVF